MGFERLPAPRLQGQISLEAVMAGRRSVREFSSRPMSLEQLSQLLWAAQGVSSVDGRRTAPSAGALYPLDIYAVVGSVSGLDTGIYRYRPQDHGLEAIRVGTDARSDVVRAALRQDWIGSAAVILVATAAYSRTTQKYGDRGRRYVHMEVGHASQNICLQAQALGLGAVTVGAFRDGELGRILELAEGESPLALIPVGRPDGEEQR